MRLASQRGIGGQDVDDPDAAIRTGEGPALETPPTFSSNLEGSVVLEKFTDTAPGEH